LDYQGNTRKEREKAEKKKGALDQATGEPRKPKEKNIERVVITDVIQKPKGPGRRFKEIFLGGDARQAAAYVGRDVLLPALRNLIVDMVTKGAERMVYGESSYRRRPGINYRAQYQGIQYNRPFDPRDPIRDPRERAYSTTSRVRQNRHEINDVIIATKEEADLVVERLADILDKYEVVSLADLNDLIGLQTSHIDNKWGWTYLGNLQVRQIRQGYLLELPPLEEI
jgi:hypothetical protein